MRLVTCAFALEMLMAPVASAIDGGVNFAWQSCYPEGGTVSRTSTCVSSLGSAGSAIGSFLMDQSIVVVGFEASVLVQVEAGAIPPWWQLFNPGSCRQSAASLNADFTSSPNQVCHDPWNGTAATGIAAYFIAPGGEPNLARLIAQGSIAVANPIPAQQEHYAFRLSISNSNTMTCGGCAVPATLMLQSLRIDASVGGGFVFHHLTRPLQNQCITWQNAQNICATEALPNRSWGQIKSLYR